MIHDYEISSPKPGVVVTTHARHLCAGKPCCIHNPSDHHMKDWPMTFRPDRRVVMNGRAFVLTERICEHGVGHPDPDSLAFAEELGGRRFAEGFSSHGCDGCCAG